jgi:hypothetical protein
LNIYLYKIIGCGGSKNFYSATKNISSAGRDPLFSAIHEND